MKEVLKYWDHANDGELSTREVQKTRQLEVRVFEQGESRGTSAVLFQAQDCQGAHRVRWKNRGKRRSRLVAKEFRRGSKIDGFTNFSDTPLLELVKLMISQVATARWDQAAWFGHEGRKNNSGDSDDAHRHQ